MNLIKRLSMVILMENNLEAAVEFYTKLGFTPVFHLKDKWAEFDLDGIQIGLCPIEQKFDDFRTGVVFQIDDLKDFYEKNNTTITFLDKPFEAVHGIMASIKDPGGNIIDLYQPTPQKVQEFANKMAQENAGKGCCKKDVISAAAMQEKSVDCCKAS